MDDQSLQNMGKTGGEFAFYGRKRGLVLKMTGTRNQSLLAKVLSLPAQKDVNCFFFLSYSKVMFFFRYLSKKFPFDCNAVLVFLL